MTKKNIYTIRFLTHDDNSTQDVKARFLYQYPQARTRAQRGSPHFDSYYESRLFLVETEELEKLNHFSHKLARTHNATVETGLKSIIKWWAKGHEEEAFFQQMLEDDEGALEEEEFCIRGGYETRIDDLLLHRDRSNGLVALVYNHELTPETLRWFYLSFICREIEPDADPKKIENLFRRVLALPEAEQRMGAFKLLDYFFNKHIIPNLSCTEYFWCPKERFDADWERFLGGEKENARSFIEESELLEDIFLGPAAVTLTLTNLKDRIDTFDRELTETSGIENLNNGRASIDAPNVSCKMIEKGRANCLELERLIHHYFPDSWLTRKCFDALELGFTTQSKKISKELIATFRARYPEARISKMVGLYKGIKHYVTAFLLLREPDNESQRYELSTFGKELVDKFTPQAVNVSIVAPASSANWDTIRGGIADFSIDNMAWEVARLAYDTHAAPTEVLRSAMIYDVLVNQKELREEAIRFLGSASERHLREFGFMKFNNHTSSNDQYYSNSFRDDYKRFVLNGKKERAGAFLRESNLCLQLRMNIENAIRYMDLEDKSEDWDLFM